MTTDLALDDDLMRRASPQFIAELAARINEPRDVLKKYEITPQELYFLRELPSFRNAYKEAKQFWESDANTKDRIAIKAAVLVEDSLLDVYDIIKKSDANLAARLDAFKQLKEIAGVDSKAQAAGAASSGGQKVFVNIKFGGTRGIQRELDVAPIVEIEGEVAE